jgi:arylsulfatase A-like enzyme
MRSWTSWTKQTVGWRQRKRQTPRARLGVEALEERSLLNAAPGPDQHVLLLSVDGLHQADVADPSLQGAMTNILQLKSVGINYTAAHTTSPSDSFPGELSILTGASPGTTGVFYDDSYSRTLRAPGSDSSTPPGTEVTYFEAIDKNSALISGGGNFDASSIDPSLLPIDPTTNQVVYPNQFLQTNTIFDVAHNAGLYTAFSDKHPAYQIANGPNAAAINDFYGPEINSTTALQINGTNQTVNADAVLNDNTQAAQGLTITPGYNASVFATGPAGATQPDSITVDGLNVFVGYNNGAAKDGSSGSSTIALFQPGTNGSWNVTHTWSIPGHNDGLKVDPSTHLVWSLQNEDANPTLVIINPTTFATTQYAIKSVNHGGGFDDIAFATVNGVEKVFFTASNPSKNPNTDPAVVQVTLNNSKHTANTSPVLFGNAAALNTVTQLPVTLNLQDPDSMTTDPNGNLVFTDQADNQLVTIHNPTAFNQFATVTPLTDAASNPVSADDSLFNPGATGEILMTDQTTGTIYQITVPAGSSAQVFSTGVDIGELGTTNLTTGLFTPVITGLGSPRGLAFINAGPYTDLSNYTLVDPSTDPQGPSDPNLTNDTTHNVLLTERYDDLKVAAILKEIQGQKSHNFFSMVAPQIPAIFGMNFQAVSVAQKDAHGGINLLPNGQEGLPSSLLEGAIQHTDQSIGQIVAALKSAGIYNSTLLVLTAKHGQDPRVGLGGLMPAGTLSGVLGKAPTPIPVAQATEDDVSLLWLQNQSQTFDAVAALQAYKATGTINVFFQGVPVTLPVSQVIKQIIADTPNADASLGSFHLGNPATDSTTPDIVVTLQPGYIWVGNVNNKHKRAEHGGFNEDDTHIALILSGGAIGAAQQGTTQTASVLTQQIAVTALDALGLNPNNLTGVVKDHTTALPGTGIPAFHSLVHHATKARLQVSGLDPDFIEGKAGHNVVVATINDSDPNALNDIVAIIRWGDGTQSTGRLVRVAPNKYEILGSHTYREEGVYHVSVGVTDRKTHAHTTVAFQDDVSAPTNEKEGSLQDNIEDGFWSKVASLKHK